MASESTKSPFNGENGNVRNRSGRSRNGKGPKKVPQRGVGVEKLEKMRVEAESLRTFHQQQQQVMINNNMNNVVGSGFSGFVPFVGNKSGFGASSSSSASSNGYGWFGQNPFLNSSKELSSIPNLNHHHQSLDLCLKKTLLNEENIMMRGENAKRDMPMQIWNHVPVHHNFVGFMPQPAQSSVYAYPTQKLEEKTNAMMRGTNARREMPLEVLNHHNFLGLMPQSQPQPSDECVEVVAVHRRRDSSLGSGKVFMEYGFFPEKDGKATTTTFVKDLFPTTTTTTNSLVGFGSGGEASSSITFSSYGDTSSVYDDSLDLSLRL